MKKYYLQILAVVLAIMVFSCQKDEFSEQDALDSVKKLSDLNNENEKKRDSLNNAEGIITYAVHVVPVNEKSYLKSSISNFEKDSTDSVMVTVSQWGKVITKRADRSGMVVFNDLRTGSVSVSVESPNYSNVDLIAEIIPERDSNVLRYYGVVRYAATLVPVFSIKNNLATISGKVTLDSDLTNKTPEAASNIDVVGLIDVSNNLFKNNYIFDFGNDDYGYYTRDLDSDAEVSIVGFEYYKYYTGKIRQMAYSNTEYKTKTDSLGNFSIKVPSSPDGLPVKISVSEFTTNQKLYLNILDYQQVNGIQNIRTFFGAGIAASPIPWVPAAYVTFSAPTGDPNIQPTTTATGTVIVGESGIASITVSNSGEGYTQAPIVVVNKGTGYNAIAAEAQAVLSNGKVVGVTITNPGQGYTPSDGPSVYLKDVLVAAGAPTPVFNYSIIGFNQPGGTHGFESVPVVTISSTKGSGATVTPIMSGYINTSKITVNNTGDGYTSQPNVSISAPEAGGTQATATATMSGNNPLHSVKLTSSYYSSASYWYETTPVATIVKSSGNGSGATATATLRTSGRVNRIVLSNAGSGYDPALPPAVTITGGGGSGASADASVNGDGSITINVVENGSGYTSDPVVSISAPPSGGTQAVATAVRAYKVDQIVVTNGGSAYNTNTTTGQLTNTTLYLDGTNLTSTNAILYASMKVNTISITNAGSRYQSAPTVTITSKDGNGAGASVSVELLYNIESLNVTNEGSGYQNVSDIKVNIEAAPGTYTTIPTFTPYLGKGVLAEVQLAPGLGGEGYTATPYFDITTGNVTINGTSYGFTTAQGRPVREAKVTPIISNGSVTGFTINDAGEGYNYPTGSYTASISTKTGSASLAATVNKNSGQIIGVNITNSGNGYTVAPYIEFVINGSANNPYGTNAVATASIADGKVTGVTISNPGSGYYSAPSVQFVIPTNAAVAKGYCVFDANGSVTSINLFDEQGRKSGDVGFTNASGFGYISTPEVTITPTNPGMGRDAKAIAKISNGRVTSVEMINKGIGYLAKNIPGITSQNQTPTYSTAYDYISYPTYAGKSFEVRPINTAPDGNGNVGGITVTSGKSYIRDIYLGTGKRETDGRDY